MLLSFAIGAFVMFLLHLRDNVPQDQSLQTDKEAVQKAVKPEFDFYTLLPETEVIVDVPEVVKPLITAPVEEVASPQKLAVPSYIVQVGSFKKMTDADAFRAKLALLGIESKVQSVTIDNKETYHRVQIGPIAGRTQADSLQKQLKENQIDSILLKAKQG
jgi:cell division protein FtsN